MLGELGAQAASRAAIDQGLRVLARIIAREVSRRDQQAADARLLSSVAIEERARTAGSSKEASRS